MDCYRTSPNDELINLLQKEKCFKFRNGSGGKLYNVKFIGTVNLGNVLFLVLEQLYTTDNTRMFVKFDAIEIIWFGGSKKGEKEYRYYTNGGSPIVRREEEI